MIDKVNIDGRDYPVTLPPWITSIRPPQIQAVEEIKDAFDRGVGVVFLDAPTGTGKTLIGELVRQVVNPSTPSTYICHSKALQDQFLNDFPYAKVLKGRSNYPTINRAVDFNNPWQTKITADDCSGEGCDLCPTKTVCPYQVAKRLCLDSDLRIVNTAYYLAECNGPGNLSESGLVIADEADTLESELMNHVSVEVPVKWREMIGVPDKATVENTWVEWIRRSLPRITEAKARVSPTSPDIKIRRQHRSLTNLYLGLRLVLAGLENGDSKWVYTGRNDAASFRPVTVDSFGEGKFWRHSEKHLLMSATCISFDEMASSLGLGSVWHGVSLGCSFPKEQRPIKYRPVADMSAKNKEVAWPKMVEEVSNVVNAHPDERVLVHTVSYALGKQLYDGIKVEGSRPIITYTSSMDKDRALQEYLAYPNSILIAPSMDRGVDLPGDKCRVQVITKVPFLSLGDRQTAQRLYATKTGQTWYNVQAIRTIVQMTGRGMRSKDDACVTYILDKKFNEFYNKTRRLWPTWWVEAVIWREGR